MPIFIHLTVETNIANIMRNGIKAANTSLGTRGVFCMVSSADFHVSHQWLRELRRAHPGRSPITAVDFRIDSQEILLISHYAQPPKQVSAGEAVKIILSVNNPLGFQILIPRSITRKEIHKIRRLPQVIGWRYSPEAKGKRPFCTCKACTRSDYGSSKLRRRLPNGDERALSKKEIMSILQKGTDTIAMEEALYALGNKRRGNPEELEFLVEYNNAGVQRALVYALQFYSGKKAKYMLAKLLSSEYEEVRMEAEQYLIDNKEI